MARVIIAGCRDYWNYETLLQAVQASGFTIDCVLSGHATGVDRLGERYARENGKTLELYEADWKTYGRRAGPLRNATMAARADALIALWDGKSPGTKNMIDTARAKGLRVYVAKL